MSGAARLERDIVRVSGADAPSYLQGQLSQDVDALSVGSSAFTLLLEPDGKLGYWLRVTRTADDTFVLDIDGGYGAGLQDRLERFKLRVDATVEPLDWIGLRVVADEAGEAGESSAAVAGAEVAGTGAEIAAPFRWATLVGVDLLGPAIDIPPGVPEISASELECRRIAAGWPLMGSEITEGRIPAETGVVESSVSFTKGCFTGQELVARIDSRGGNVPRHLRGVLVDGDPPHVGDDVVVDGDLVGHLTSAAALPGDEPRAVALAYVKRSVDVPAEATVADRPARLEALPIPV